MARFSLFLLMALFVMSPQHVVHAQNAQDSEVEQQDQLTEEQEAKKALLKAQKEALQDKTAELMRTLDQKQLAHFVAMYSNYNLYNVVQTVRQDLEDAVNECIANNKDMANEISNRFAKWKSTVDPKLQAAFENVENLRLAQNYMPQSEVKALFKLVDQVRDESNTRFNEIPLTSAEGCEYMMSQMDQTEKGMVGILQTTLVSYPGMLQKTQE